MVCASISASLMGLAPLETELRRRFRMWMKSEAEITPAMLASLASHSGAEAVPCVGRGRGGEVANSRVRRHSFWYRHKSMRNVGN